MKRPCLPDGADPSNEELPISTADLSSLAVERLLRMLNAPDEDIDVEIAEAVAQMAQHLGIGDRNTSITFTEEHHMTIERGPLSATIDRGVRERMQRLSGQPPTIRDDTLVGVLFEADFEAYAARLRLPEGTVVTVKFGEDLADDIQSALRSRAGFDGVVRYHLRTAQATSVELREVITAAQLPLDDESFWHDASFAELQAAQGVTGRAEPANLVITDLTDDERAGFLAALHG